VTLSAYVLLAAATSISAAGGDPVSQRTDATVAIAQVMIRQRVIVRVPAMPEGPTPTRPLRWKEKKGPKCVPLSALAGAAITERNSFDLFLRGGTRLRARLDDDCPALDYYSGFYVRPTADGQMCERRDSIHTRAGGQCTIERIRTLVPDR
jgi:hypothetical protein